MTDSIKLIWSRIPKKRVSSIVTFVVGYFAKLLLDLFLHDEPFKLSEQAIPALTGSAVLLVMYFVCAFVYYSIRMVSELKEKAEAVTIESETKEPSRPTKTPLPDSKVVIGTLKKESLFADIEAKIVLQENGKPDIENFLTRITMGKPYCPKCLRPMDDIAADWRSLDTSPVGYYCVNCKTNSRGHYDYIVKDGQALVRKDYETYWKVYQSKIDELTNGERQRFTIA
jgi:hypothetical protein